MYCDLFQLSYDLLRSARRDGLLRLEEHVNNPHSSSIFQKYPRFSENHHAVEFLCGGLSPIIEGVTTPDQMPALLDAELRVLEDEHHAQLSVLLKTADALPGFGIVAAVLGIVVTMGAIDGPVQEIGHKVGAALVGTFLGILLSYGFLNPLAGRMELLGAEELAFFRTIKYIILGASNSFLPRVTIELARRGVGTEFRPTRAELESLFRAIDLAGNDAPAKPMAG
jgi:chemotaxis protein MotA